MSLALVCGLFALGPILGVVGILLTVALGRWLISEIPVPLTPLNKLVKAQETIQ